MSRSPRMVRNPAVPCPCPSAILNCKGLLRMQPLERHCFPQSPQWGNSAQGESSLWWSTIKKNVRFFARYPIILHAHLFSFPRNIHNSNARDTELLPEYGGEMAFNSEKTLWFVLFFSFPIFEDVFKSDCILRSPFCYKKDNFILILSPLKLNVISLKPKQ